MLVALVSYLTIHRHRVVYSLSTAVLRPPEGSRDDVHAFQTEHIDKKLRSGKYNVLQILQRPDGRDFEIILGQIKK